MKTVPHGLASVNASFAESPRDIDINPFDNFPLEAHHVNNGSRLIVINAVTGCGREWSDKPFKTVITVVSAKDNGHADACGVPIPGTFDHEKSVFVFVNLIIDTQSEKI